MKTSLLSLLLVLLILGHGNTQSIFPGTLRDGNLSEPYVWSVGSWSYDFEDFHYRGDNFASNSRNDYMNFRLMFPTDYDSMANADKKYPMVVMLHGAGESGRAWAGNFTYGPSDPEYDNNSHNLLHGGKYHRDAVLRSPTHEQAFPGFVLFPQNHYSGAWENGYGNPISNNNRYVINIIEELITSLKIDPNRIYVHGLSNGGKGTWDIIYRRPDLFAAALPMSAVGSPTIHPPVVAHIPIWLSQGGEDTNPHPNAANALIDAFASAGAPFVNVDPSTSNVPLPEDDPSKHYNRYTLYPDLGHGVWNSTYSRMDFFKWMLSKSKLDIRVFGGETAFCPSAEINVKLGVSPGFDGYAWSKDDIELPNETGNEILATSTGAYRVRLLRGNEWTQWSEPVEITRVEVDFQPTLTAANSFVIPSLDGSSSTQLQAPAGYASYRWFRNNVQLTESNQNIYQANETGQYSVSVQLPGGCYSLLSNVVHVSSSSASGPATPTGLTASAISGVEVLLSWTDNSSDETGFELYRSSGGSGYQFIGLLENNTTSFNDSGLIPGTAYTYKMRAVNNNGGSAYTNDAAVSTSGDFSNPSPPQNLAVAGSTDHSISILWTASTDDNQVSKYEVFVDGNKHGEVDGTEYTIDNLDQGVVYSIKVRAVDISGNLSAFSPQIAGATLDVAGNGVAYKFYTGSWEQLPEFESLTPFTSGTSSNFNISARPGFINNNFGFVFSSHLEIDVEGTYSFYTTSDDGSRLLINGQVVVENDGLHGPIEESGEVYLMPGKHPISVLFFERSGGESLQVRYEGPELEKQLIPNNKLFLLEETTIPPGPVAPGDLVAEPGSIFVEIQLSWSDNSSDETGFEIYRSDNSGGPYEIINTLSANTTSYLDKDVTPEQPYYYIVKSINQNGASQPSDPASAVAPPTPPAPAAPSDLSVQNNTSNSLSLNWTDNSNNEEKFILERSSDYGVTFQVVAEIEGNIVIYIDENLTPNQLYYYRVKSVNAGGESEYSNLAFTATNPVPIKVNFQKWRSQPEGWINSPHEEPTEGLSFNLTDEVGSPSSISLTLASNFDGMNYQGSTTGNNSGVYPDEVINNGYQVGANPGSIKLSGLDQSKTYKLTFFGSRRFSTNALTVYSVGSNSVSLNAYNNNSQTASLENIPPDENGEILVTISRGAGASAGYINALVITEMQVEAEIPEAPNSIAASVSPTNAITLNWIDASDNESGFEIFRSSTVSDTLSLLTSVEAGIQSFHDTVNIEGDKTYYYLVRAFNNVGASEFTDTLAVVTYPEVPPMAPTDLTATVISPVEIHLTWSDNNDNEIQFTIYRANVSDSIFAEIGTVGADTTTYEDKNLSENSTYLYRVSATNAWGASDFTETIVATTLPYPPSQPSGLLANPLSQHEISLTWDSLANADGYRLFRSEESEASFEMASMTTATDYVDSALQAGVLYYYVLQAFNDGGDSEFSDTISVATLPNAPVAPGNLADSAISASTVELTWTDNSDNEEGFNIYRSVDLSTFDLLGTTSAGVNTFIDDERDDISQCLYMVKAFNAGGESAASETITSFSMAPAPSNLSAVAVSASLVDLSWTDNSDNETGFIVQRSLSADGPFDDIFNSGSGGEDLESYADSTVHSGSTYFYRVAAFNAVGVFSYSETISVTTFPAAPVLLSAQGISNESLEVSWAVNSDDPDYYELFRRIEGTADFELVYSAQNSEINFVDGGLLPHTAYEYRLRAVKSELYSEYSTILTGVTRNTTPEVISNSGLTAFADSTTFITISATDADGDDIVLTADELPEFIVVAGTSSNNIELSVTPLPAHIGLHNFNIIAADGFGGSDTTSFSIQVIEAAEAPIAPTLIGAEGISTASINVTWALNPETPEGYELFRRREGDIEFESVYVAGASETAYVDDDLLPHSAYEYKLRAFADGIYSEFSNMIAGSTLNSAPVVDIDDELIVSADSTKPFSITATDDDGDIVTLLADALPEFVTVTANNTNSIELLATPLAEHIGTHNINIVANDDFGGTDTATFAIEVIENVNSNLQLLHRINAGGNVLANAEMDWTTDHQTSPSPYLASTSANATTGWNYFPNENNSDAPDHLFGTQRWGAPWGGPIEYILPVQGDVDVTLYFAERPGSPITGPNQRIFNVEVEGQQVLTNFDIFSEAGTGAIAKNFTLNVADGNLNIVFIAVQDYPIISGIQVKGDPTLNTPNARIQTTPTFEKAKVVVYPNQFDRQLMVSFNEVIYGETSISLLDKSGRVIFSERYEVDQFNNLITINLTDAYLTEGLYFLQIENRSVSEVHKLIRF